MKRLIGMISALGLVAGLGSCVFVTDDTCDEGTISCDGEVIEECVHDSWVLIEDCWSFCGGYCDFDQYSDPVCVC